MGGALTFVWRGRKNAQATKQSNNIENASRVHKPLSLALGPPAELQDPKIVRRSDFVMVPFGFDESDFDVLYGVELEMI